MRWELSDEQQSLQESARGWLDSVAPTTTVREWLETGGSQAFTAKLVADGWHDIGLDEDRGGQGGGLVELALLAQELAAHAVPSGPWLARTIARWALSLDPAASDMVGPAGEAAVILAVDAGAVPAPLPDLTVSADDRLSGTIPRVLGAESADTLIVPVSTGDTSRAWVVNARDAGVSRTPHTLVDRSRDVADVHLNSVQASVLAVDVPALLRRAARSAAVLLAADSVGAMQEMLNRTVEYTTQRHQFGVPVGSFQAVKHGAATMLVSLEAARSIAFFGAASVHAGEELADHHAAVAKAQATAEGATVAETALTLHGAIGYTWEHDLHLFYKRAKLNTFLYGSPAAWNDDLATRLGLAGWEK